MNERTAVADSGAIIGKLREIVSQELELEDGELTPTGHFVEDYEGDSLSLITVVARIEKEVGVVIPKSDLPELLNFELLAAAVREYGEAARA
ncbi:acyl carrier protein [Nocardiopsis sp. CT-R113]|uniref:Acyl carrier protein n=1 Tax=Nocardiopsis codii TaxID=3065942 RepID=A0ABU7KBA2_9ACTN|nr:acyl carrier protein [Nocardiopsis sp. CT-R113]MEE2039307.1 acyl carrier protein [Nocardiopsis sp. CT-R113]